MSLKVFVSIKCKVCDTIISKGIKANDESNHTLICSKSGCNHIHVVNVKVA